MAAPGRLRKMIEGRLRDTLQILLAPSMKPVEEVGSGSCLGEIGAAQVKTV